MIFPIAAAATLMLVTAPTPRPAPPPAPPVVLASPCRAVTVAGVLEPGADGGRQLVPRWGLWVYPRAGANNTYVVGHHPGPLSWLVLERVGDQLCFAGRRWRIVSVRIVSMWDLTPLAASPASILTLQTCATPDGLWLRIVVAVPA